MGYDIRNMGNTLARQLADKQEAFLIDFFGSYEKAIKIAHLYVFEIHEAKFSSPEGVTGPDGLQQDYRVTQEVRIRPKTHEELVKEALDAD